MQLRLKFQKKIIFSIFISLFISFFSSNAYAQKANLSKYQSQFNKELKAWTKTIKNFNLSVFSLTTTKEFENIEYMDDSDLENFYSIYKPVLTFSKSKNQFIDIYSYQLNLEKEGNQVVSKGQEPDQAVILYNHKTKIGHRIFFSGPSQSIQEIVWLSESKFILVGINDDQTPLIIIGDIAKNELEFFESENKVSQMQEYVSPKLKSLNIKYKNGSN